MDCQIVNPSNGRSDGLILFWKREIKIELIFFAPMYIDVCVIESTSKVWRQTGIYGVFWEMRHKIKMVSSKGIIKQCVLAKAKKITVSCSISL
jgi:hypothetical protein